MVAERHMNLVTLLTSTQLTLLSSVDIGLSVMCCFMPWLRFCVCVCVRERARARERWMGELYKDGGHPYPLQLGQAEINMCEIQGVPHRRKI